MHLFNTLSDSLLMMSQICCDSVELIGFIHFRTVIQCYSYIYIHVYIIYIYNIISRLVVSLKCFRLLRVDIELQKSTAS